MTGAACHKANGTITTLALDNNKIGVEGAIKLAGALKATFCDVFFQVRTACSSAITGAGSRLQPSVNFGTEEVNLDWEIVR